VYTALDGAFTGELSITQLQSIGVQSVLIGHSERRQVFAENNEMITQKVKAARALFNDTFINTVSRIAQLA
jgi:triosephosphate isomerase